ncbi:SCO2322 family protein [Streptomyces sp. NRRL S-350]|uniref:SCO2322 family protein n=1 Tax=Streptomyces sp. NRRL S-350 TaxID=1463902 RepID=UPI001EEE398C|nr:SCO2322 family protein [Streptomyces sp. NRRL S-350]
MTLPARHRRAARARDCRVAARARNRRAVRARSGLAVLLLPLVGALLVSAGAAPAEAAGYRYWSFWRGAADGVWAYQQQGPAIAVPPDGAVDGWRFATSPDGGQGAANPRPAGSFAAVCADTPALEGHKRVAVVLDFGTAEDSGSSSGPSAGPSARPSAGPSAGAVPEPRTACASVEPRATSAEVLAAVAPPLRYDTNGLLCAIAGYPKAGCADQVGAAGAAPADNGSSSSGHGGGPDVGLIAGGALVAVLAAGAFWQARRRRSS